MHDEQTLVEAARRGDRGAFAALYDRFAPLIRAICFDQTGDSAACEDLAQDVFLRAYGKLPGLRKTASFGSWLIGITKNRAREWHRARRREDCVPALAQTPVELEEHSLSDLHEAIRQLPERARMAVRLFYLHDVPAAEASQIMQISLSGFYAALAQARSLLRSRLDAEERRP